MKTHSKNITVIGAGLAGCEAAYYLARKGIDVTLYDCKPKLMSPAHSSADFAELICSNSLKSSLPDTAGGLLKNELEIFDSLIVEAGKATAVAAGSALAVNRDAFSAYITEKIKNHPNITVFPELIENIPDGNPVIIATGPLTMGGLNDAIAARFGGNLSFYDAAAPIVTLESVDMSCAFWGSRYGKGGDDYLNCPMTEEEYGIFYEALIGAERATLKDFEKNEVFEGCMPVEVMAARGRDSLRFGPMRPVGFKNPDGKRPFAVLQLRRENAAGTILNLVGFQTNLKFGEQKRVFGLIPALKNAEFVRYGVMHRNTFINAPKVINTGFQCKDAPDIFIAGQLSGVEGYVESTASGMMAAISALRHINGLPPLAFPTDTMMGALAAYIATPNESFQPMNANFGILPPIEGRINKKERKAMYSARAIASMTEFEKLLV